MSKTLACIGSKGTLAGFASALAAKATGSKVTVVNGTSGDAAIAVEEYAPKGTHTAVVSGADATSPLYGDLSKVRFVRSVLPRRDDNLGHRDMFDVAPEIGIDASAEIKEAQDCFQRTAAVAVKAAKESGANKITIMEKRNSKYKNINTAFNDTVSEAAKSAGVALDIVGSSQVTNRLVMFPETLGVVVAADTPVAENTEAMVSALFGGAAATYYGAAPVFGGSSRNAVANSVAAALKSVGMTAEAGKVTEAVKKAGKTNDDGAAVLSAL